ncbi:asparaginase [Tropicibacter sp. R15_0]|uniref:asparaginase n=1 Tax=Tropicibacter sp. R15_0 TaxID=2821101 RepID=UPI001ADD1D6B|nr:asparaginase [Tropicibacter sp. R15_0]MBO9466419.1 asparaginase [Tropicibacter sp. R15_0]
MRILLVHTGGTIGMVQTDDGFAPQKGVVEAEVDRLINAGEITASVDIVTLEPLIDSAQATPVDWSRIAHSIHAASADYDGFVVTHGTDTLAYTAGALCLALPGVRQPVIVTGAMLPLTVTGTDGSRNLREALLAAQSTAPGVWVQFAGRLLHGARVRKSHSSSFDAFEAEACDIAPLLPAAEPGCHEIAQHNVGIFSITPGPCMDLLAHAVERCEGLVLRCYGSGTAPDTPEMRTALAKAQAKGIPVIAVSQCPEGGMKLGTYAAGKVMRDNGVVDGRDITPEMAYVKMHACLTRGGDYETSRAFLATSQCGELAS